MGRIMFNCIGVVLWTVTLAADTPSNINHDEPLNAVTFILPETCNGDVNAFNTSCPHPCPATCASFQVNGKTEPDLCKIMCDAFGCQCKEGFVHDDVIKGVCVEPKDCSPVSCDGDPNAVDTTCPSPCPATCKSYKENGKTEPGLCDMACKDKGCQCMEGYVRDESTGYNNCVKPENCHAGCNGVEHATNMVYTPGCRATCDNRKAASTCLHHLQKRVLGCVCNKGYIYDQIKRKCVVVEQCTPGCGGDPNAEFYACGWCEQTCEKMNDPWFCVEICRIPGDCGCKIGYVKDTSGKCIRPIQCAKKKCEVGQTYRCPKHCSAVKCTDVSFPRKCLPETQEDIDGCVPDCVCDNENLVRDGNNQCIAKDTCPAIQP